MNDWRSYDDVAETYERVNAPRFAAPGRDLVALAAPPAGGRILDVGTGTGVVAEAAAEAVGPEGMAVGVDVSLSMMNAGRGRRSLPHFVAGEAIDLPFRGGTFDAVAGNFVVAHFTRAETALFDMLRVLRPGGRLALSSWPAGEDELEKTWRSLVQEVVQEELLRDVELRAAPGRERFGKRESIEETLIDAGLRHVRTEQREYRFVFTVEEYVAGRSTWAVGRFVREMLGPQRFEDFLARTRGVFAEHFADPLHDFRDVWLAVGTKP